MNAEQQIEFKKNKELNFAVVSESAGRFRASAFYQRGEIGMVLRRIETANSLTRLTAAAADFKRAGNEQARHCYLCRRHRHR